MSVEEIPVSYVPMDYIPPDYERECARAEKRMHEFLESGELRGVKTETVIEEGFLWPAISKVINEHQVDLIVLGTHGRGAFKRLLLGSVAEDIFRHATCPVLTIGPHVKPVSGEYDRLQKILFATDFAPSSMHALDYALALTEEHGAQLLLLHVVRPPSMPVNLTDQLVNDSQAKLKELIPDEFLPVRRPIAFTQVGFPADEIVAMAEWEHADLIVMGMHNPTGMATHWPFEVAAQVVGNATCPVLSVRSEIRTISC